MTDVAPAHRPLSGDEADLLGILIARGASFDAEVLVTAADRARWAAQVAATHAGTPCGCGTCPSIELTDADGVTPDAGTRVVLEAGAPDGYLLLFIDDDRLSYLEYAPTSDAVLSAFPRADALTFD